MKNKMALFEKDKKEMRRERSIERGDITVEVSERFPTDEEREKKIAYFKDERICEIFLKKKDGDKFRLNDILPEKGYFVQQDNTVSRQLMLGIERVLQACEENSVAAFPRNILIPRFRKEERKISIPTDESKIKGASLLESVLYESHDFFKMKGSFIGLLHEIGHTNSREKNEEEKIKSYFYRIGGVMAEKDKHDILKQNDEKIKDYIDTVLKEERSAWAFALNAYRNLLAQGYDVEPEMSLKDILECIHRALRSYAPTNFPDLLDKKRRSFGVKKNKNNSDKELNNGESDIAEMVRLSAEKDALKVAEILKRINGGNSNDSLGDENKK